MHGVDRLSDLSNDLIASIISLLPAREAARTSALSRRWRPIWLGTESLNLDSRSYGDPGKDHSSHHGGGSLAGIKMNYRLFSDASKFLGAAGRCGRINKLSMTVEGCGNEYFEEVMGNNSDSYDLMTSLLGAPPLRHMEELRVRFEQEKLTHCIYKLDPTVLPGHTLRVLDLVFGRLESQPPQGGAGAVFSFPCLSVLRLYWCSSPMQDLEGLVRAAPSLWSMHIEDHSFYCLSGPGATRSDRFALHSASLTDLTLVDTCGSIGLEGTELDTPCLRTFKYNSFILRGVWMMSQLTKLARADLTLGWTYCENSRDLVLPSSAQVWKFRGHFRHAKAIRLKVQNIWCIAVKEHAQHDHLVMLPALQRLELEGFADPDPRHATAITNLLQCCPVIRDLRIRTLRDPYQTSYADESNVVSSSSDFDVSMDLFRRRFSKEMVPLMLDRDNDDGSSRVAELPGLTGCRFNCLENHLKKVTLRFELKELDSFEVRLAKFFAENCMGLEALQIHDGKHNFLSHTNWMVQRWRTDALDQRKHIIGWESADSSKQFRKRKGDTAVEHKVQTKRNYRKRT